MTVNSQLKKKGLRLKSIQQRKTKSQRTAEDEALTCRRTSLPNLSCLALKHHTSNPDSHKSFLSFLQDSFTQLGCRIFEIPKLSSAEPVARQRAEKPDEGGPENPVWQGRAHSGGTLPSELSSVLAPGGDHRLFQQQSCRGGCVQHEE